MQLYDVGVAPALVEDGDFVPAVDPPRHDLDRELLSRPLIGALPADGEGAVAEETRRGEVKGVLLKEW